MCDTYNVCYTLCIEQNDNRINEKSERIEKKNVEKVNK